MTTEKEEMFNGGGVGCCDVEDGDEKYGDEF
jgi:hypothetical protein